MKKTLSVVLTIMLLLCQLPFAVSASEAEASLLENNGLRTAYIFYETDMGLIQDASSPFSFVSGDKHRLPSYAEAAAFAPEGLVPVSVLVGKKTAALGEVYTFTDDDGDGVVIRPVYGYREEEIIFEDTLEAFDENTNIVYGGASPNYLTVPVNGMSEDWASYADCFAYHSVGFPDVRVLTDRSGSNKALLMDMWYSDSVLYGIELCGTDGGSMKFDVPGAYRVSMDVYVPSVIRQTRTQPAYEGTGNAAGFTADSLLLRADLAGQTSYALKTLPISSDILDTWQTVSFDITLSAGQTLDNVLLYTSGSHSQFYADNIRFSRVVKSANIYLDAAAAVPAKNSPRVFSTGETLSLPTYEELLPYAPAHTVPLGFLIGGRFFAPGAKYTFDETDSNGMTIVPSFGVPTKPDFGDLILNVDFEEIADGSALVWNGASPLYAELPLGQSVSEAYAPFADTFSMHAADSFAGMTVRNDFTGKNRALHIENWYTATPIQSAVRVSAPDGQPLGLDMPGSYSASISVYVPSVCKQVIYSVPGGANANLLGKTFLFYAETTDGVTKNTHAASYTIDAGNTDAWQTLNISFTLGKGESLSRLVASVTSLNGEFYLDNLRLTYNDNSVAYRKCIVYTDAARSSSVVTYCRPNDTVTLPEASALTDNDPAKRVFLGFVCGGKLYEAGSTVKVSEIDGGIEFVPSYRELFDAKYGELVAYEDFAAHAVGTDPSGSAFAWQAEGFANGIAFGADYSSVHTIVDKGDHRALMIGKTDNVLWQWPQLGITLSKPLTDGEYTIVCDVTFPGGGKGVDAAAVRVSYQNGSGESTYSDASAPFAANESAKVVNTRAVDGTNCRAITDFLLFISCNNITPGSYYEVNSISLYARRSHAVFHADGASYSVNYTPGNELILPERYDVMRLAPKGKRAVGFAKDGKNYAFGDTYQTEVTDASLDFDIVLADVRHTVAFSLGDINGTVADITVMDGGTVTLPAPPASAQSNFDGWIIPSLGRQNAGSTFVYDDAALARYCDADGRLIVNAAWKNVPTVGEPVIFRAPTDNMFTGAAQEQIRMLAAAYGTGVYPASDTFDGTAAVSGIRLIRTAASLYNVFYGTLTVTTDAAVCDFAEEKGIVPADFDAHKTMTVADAALLLANAMPDDRYTVSGGLITLESAALTKLARAGILPENAAASDALTEDTLLTMLARCVDESMRKAAVKRTVWVLGDSLCAGEGVPSHTGWVRKLPAMLGDDCTLVNLAVGGWDTSNYLADSGEGRDRYASVMNGARPGDYIFIALGTNDATLWMWKDHPEVGSGWSMPYETSLANYRRYAEDARALGCIPVFICPVSRNIDEPGNKSNPYYLAYDAKIIECMIAANEGLTDPAPIINFKPVSDVRINDQMTPEERALIYYDGVHYKDYGAEVICGIFRDIVMKDNVPALDALRGHLTEASALPCGITAELSVSGAALSEDGSFTCGAFADASLDETDADAVVAFYDGNGRLKQAKMTRIHIRQGKNIIEASDVLPGFDTVRVMLFDDTETLTPVSNAANAQ